MGGGEGSTAREILRHKTVEKVIMCDIDEVIYKQFIKFRNLYYYKKKYLLYSTLINQINFISGSGGFLQVTLVG